MPEKRVLIIGTTNDYIRLLSECFGKRVLFVTDAKDWNRRSGFALDKNKEIVCNLSDRDATIAAICDHLRYFEIEASGITCFDCESLSLAAYVAESLQLPFSSPAAVAECRSKYASKELWRRNGISSPRATLIWNVNDAVNFLRTAGRPMVIKPLTGSGSEFVYLCENQIDCMRAYFRLHQGLMLHSNRRMYAPFNGELKNINPHEVYVAEEHIKGREYSCDFIIDGDRIDIIRIARKVPASDKPFGTILAYLLPAQLPGGLDIMGLKGQLLLASRVLGLKRAMAMADFIVRSGCAYLLELTPRPGGDCLPELILASSGFDILKAALDFAEGQTINVPLTDTWKSLVGLRLFAPSEGIVKSIDTQDILKDRRVISCDLRCNSGHKVILPPEDYDSWLLGTVIFQPNDPHRVENECLELRDKLKLELEAPLWAAAQIP